MTKLYDSEGVEVEAFLPADVDTKVSAAVKAKENEFTPKIKGLEDELGVAKKNLGERANQFAQFRKLTDEQAAKLDESQRLIYENGLVIAKGQEERVAIEKKNLDSLVEGSIRAKAGTNEKLVTKMKDMWGVINIEAITPEQIEQKTKMILGAINQTEPNLLASVAGFSNGSYAPPKVEGEDKGEKTFADTDKGKKMADELGLKLK